MAVAGLVLANDNEKGWVMTAPADFRFLSQLNTRRGSATPLATQSASALLRSVPLYEVLSPMISRYQCLLVWEDRTRYLSCIL